MAENKFTIPNWVHDGDHQYYCDDDKQHQLGFICEFYGFDLPRFDIWLNELPECPLKEEMLEKRDEALTALENNNNKVAKLVLSIMHIVAKNDLREQFLLPLARRGDKIVKAASKGGQTRSIWKDRAPEMQAAIDEIFREKPTASYEDIKRAANNRHGYPESALKRYTTNPKAKQK